MNGIQAQQLEPRWPTDHYKWSWPLTGVSTYFIGKFVLHVTKTSLRGGCLIRSCACQNPTSAKCLLWHNPGARGQHIVGYLSRQAMLRNNFPVTLWSASAMELFAISLLYLALARRAAILLWNCAGSIFLEGSLLYLHLLTAVGAQMFSLASAKAGFLLELICFWPFQPITDISITIMFFAEWTVFGVRSPFNRNRKFWALPSLSDRREKLHLTITADRVIRVSNRAVQLRVSLELADTRTSSQMQIIGYPPFAVLLLGEV